MVIIGFSGFRASCKGVIHFPLKKFDTGNMDCRNK